jgi:hypothetical protein
LRVFDWSRAAPENSGVPGSSPGLAITKSRMVAGFSGFWSSSREPAIGYSVGYWCPIVRRDKDQKPSGHAQLETNTTRFPSSRRGALMPTTIFRDRDRDVATRSQYWMLTVMVGYTGLGLWLLSSIAR